MPGCKSWARRSCQGMRWLMQGLGTHNCVKTGRKVLAIDALFARLSSLSCSPLAQSTLKDSNQASAELQAAACLLYVQDTNITHTFQQRSQSVCTTCFYFDLKDVCEIWNVSASLRFRTSHLRLSHFRRAPLSGRLMVHESNTKPCNLRNMN